MTGKEETRRKALVAVRRRDRAEALTALRGALERSEKIASEQRIVRSHIEALEEHLKAGSTTEKTTAGRLTRHLDNLRFVEIALKKHRETETALASASKKALHRIDDAKESVAKTQKALRPLEDQDT